MSGLGFQMSGLVISKLGIGWISLQKEFIHRFEDVIES
jgi:hypothetical protein